MLAENVACDVEGGLPCPTSTEENGEKLAIGEIGGASFQQLLARAKVCGERLDAGHYCQFSRLLDSWVYCFFIFFSIFFWRFFTVSRYDSSTGESVFA